MAVTRRAKTESLQPNGKDARSTTTANMTRERSRMVFILTEIAKAFAIFFMIIYDCITAFFSNIAPINILTHKDVEGQTVLITGAAGALGRLLAARFAAKGANLVLWDREENGLKTLKEECEKTGVRVLTYTVDMLQRDQIATAAAAVKREIGPVNMLINNAGIGIGGKIIEVAEDDIRKTVEINMMCHYWMAKEFLPDMLDRDDGHIVTIASMGGLFVSAQDMIPYCSSKFGAMAIAEGLENEVACMGKHGIRFTTVCPAYFQTQLMENLTTKPAMSVMTAEYVADAAVDGILRNLRIVLMPKSLYLVYAAKGLIPRRAISRIMLAFLRNSR